jgi:hypothetical protein
MPSTPQREGQTGYRATVAASVNAWAGRTVLASGSVAVTVSTALVTSLSLILMSTTPASLGIAHNSGGNICVGSRNPGVAFTFARATGVAVPWDETITWELLHVPGSNTKRIG